MDYLFFTPFFTGTTRILSQITFFERKKKVGYVPQTKLSPLHRIHTSNTIMDEEPEFLQAAGDNEGEDSAEDDDENSSIYWDFFGDEEDLSSWPLINAAAAGHFTTVQHLLRTGVAKNEDGLQCGMLL